MCSLWRYKSAPNTNPNLTLILDLLKPKSVGCDSVEDYNYCAKFQVIPIRDTHTYTHTYPQTHTHTHTHHVKLIAISAPLYYVVGTDNNNWGTWHHQAVELVQEIGRRTANITGDARESDFLFQ